MPPGRAAAAALESPPRCPPRRRPRTATVCLAGSGLRGAPMGLAGGFLGLLRQLLERRRIEYVKNLHGAARGTVLGVDGCAWLHRLAIPHAEQLVRGDGDARFTGLAEHFAVWCLALKQAGVNLRVVFDGDAASMPGKADEKASRAAGLAEARAALEAAGPDPDFKGGPLKAALHKVAGAMCGEEMITAVRHELARHGMGCTIAPYEADSQLVSMARAGPRRFR